MGRTAKTNGTSASISKDKVDTMRPNMDKNTRSPLTNERPSQLMEMKTSVRIDSLTSQSLGQLTGDIQALQAIGKKATLLICGRVGYMVESWESIKGDEKRTALNYIADVFGYSKQSTSAMNRVYKRFITDGSIATLSIDGSWSYGQLLEMLPLDDEELVTYIEMGDLNDGLSAAKIRELVKDVKAARNSIETTAKDESKPEEQSKPDEIKVGDIVRTPCSEEEAKAHLEYARMLRDMHAKVLRLIAKIGSEDGKMTKDGTELDKAYTEMVKTLGYYEIVKGIPFGEQASK